MTPISIRKLYHSWFAIKSKGTIDNPDDQSSFFTGGVTLWQEERGERREIELYTCFISLPFISINDFLLGLYNRDLKISLEKRLGGVKLT